ncbi:MAG: YdcF family protein [Parcubacteria group bacterium]|nr:YdcF family protein [Parcubacteria group bacterium]
MDEIDILAMKIWEYMLLHQNIETVDVIIALGSSNLLTPKKTAELYKANAAPLIVCTGGFGKDTLFDKPEAEVFKDVLIAENVPEEAILIENKATNTGENILFTKQLLLEKGIDVKKIIAVQKPYMERRTYATFKKQWPEVECIVSSYTIPYEEFMNSEASKERTINIMVGDLLRIKEYPKLGYQIEQEIPTDVWAAGQQLIEKGFNKYVL